MTTPESTTTKTRPDERGLQMYIELLEPAEVQTVRQALRDAGIATAAGCRTVTRNHEGHIITDLLIAGIWDHETGQMTCDRSCRNNPRPHRKWGQLDQEQQRSFIASYVSFIEQSRSAWLEPAATLEQDQRFDAVALSPHGPGDGRRTTEPHSDER